MKKKKEISAMRLVESWPKRLEKKGVKLSFISRQTGIPYSTLWHIVNGRTLPSIERLDIIENCLRKLKI